MRQGRTNLLGRRFTHPTRAGETMLVEVPLALTRDQCEAVARLVGRRFDGDDRAMLLSMLGVA